MKTICIFCGSSPGRMPEYVEAGRQLGCLIAKRKLSLVYGGTNVGIMGQIADEVLKNRGSVIGVITEHLKEKNIAHPGLSELRVTDTMQERKALMDELSDGFIALPGGLGTLEEFAEMLTLAQLGLHRKPCGILNACGYYDKLIDFMDYAVSQGFLKDVHRSMILIDEDPEALLNKFENYKAPLADKWVDR
ncbi:TIGR00730 family Rossman fold protein [Desulfococcaceae bacterium HSG8]|nr:TIGR00730 family Rossman fold protein [Desulfococcaceae bacterium HSG8]